jgi:hypothetical protein
VFAGTDVIAHVLADGLVESGHGHGGDGLLAEEFPGGRCVGGAQKFALGVAPLIALGAGDIESAGRDQGEQHMGVERHFIFALVVFFEIGGEPVREAGVEIFGALAIIAAADGGAAFAAFVGDHEGEASIAGAGPDRGLAEARVAEEGDVFGIHVFVLLQVVHGAAGAPAPGGDGAPFVGSGPGLPGFEEERADAVLHAAGEIGLNLAIVDGG